VDEIYRVGGAQAVAALAYGTESIRPVDKIVGPGNAYVAAAKRQVFGTVGIDMLAGPSEVLVVADADNDPDWIAADLLAQAEHDAAAQAILITDSAALADAVASAVERQLKLLPREETARRAGAISAPSLSCAAPGQHGLVDRIAPSIWSLRSPIHRLCCRRFATPVRSSLAATRRSGRRLRGRLHHVLPTSAGPASLRACRCSTS
jgi:histidinol dehydrogenase